MKPCNDKIQIGMIAQLVGQIMQQYGCLNIHLVVCNKNLRNMASTSLMSQSNQNTNNNNNNYY